MPARDGGSGSGDRRTGLIISCEHGGNRVPPEFMPLFRGRAGTLRTHRGWDPGALVLARGMARSLRAPLHSARVSRLVVDLNRSVGHPRLLSQATRDLDPDARRRLLDRFYFPYRHAVEHAAGAGVARYGSVVHVSVHSFTPVMKGQVRRTGVGLLFDPLRPAERRFCRTWAARISAHVPRVRIRMNYPYSGASDGLTTHLRARFGRNEYLGIELEINQRVPRRGGMGWARLRRALIESLRESLALL